MTILITIIAAYLILLVTWIFYVAVMSFKAKLPTMGAFAKANAYVALFLFGYPLDMIANVIVSVIVFQRLPKKVLLTGTLKYWIASDDGRRERIAAWFCAELLNPFDPSGRHC